MNKGLSNKMTSLGLLILLGMVWGTGYSIARFAMTNGVPPLGYSFWQSLGPAIVISLLSAYSSRNFSMTASRSRFYLVTGLTGIVIPNTTMYFAAPHLPAGILAMIVNTVPVIAYPMALFARLEKFNWERMIGIGCALIGLMLIILPASSLPAPEMVPWVLSTLITPVSFAFCSIYIARYRPAGSDSLVLSAGMLTFSSIMLLPMVIMSGSFYPFHYPLTMPDWVVLLEIILSSIGYVLFFQLIKIAGPVYYSLVDTIVVITGLFWGRVIFGEKLNNWTFTAVFFIVVALLLVTRYQRKPR
ncbi:MAG TPA: DMT family transporter [Gammaproteobacteria bacterium]|nr:DMT family transporter [Gammaproteobacteria bacterium]